MAGEEVDSLRGRLLIAGPTLPDPNFARTVVLMAEHGDEGALGGILNRPGWGPGQLESEVEREDWILADPDPDDLFADDAEELWGTVLTRMGGNYALIARMPVDPSVN